MCTGWAQKGCLNDNIDLVSSVYYLSSMGALFLSISQFFVCSNFPEIFLYS